MLLVLSGLPGTGKTTLAEALSAPLRAPVYSVDAVQVGLNRAGVQGEDVPGLAAYLVVEQLADGQLARGQSAIVDAVNPVQPARDAWVALAAKHATALHFVELTCSDPELHRHRLEHRQFWPGLPRPDWDSVVGLDYAPWREPRLVLDSREPLADNVARVLEAVARG